MQDYLDFAEKNGVNLIAEGSCQFCGADTKRNIHECLEIFNVGFQVLDLSERQNHKYRFLIVDAHALQHPEIHGRWSNHFHLSRLHLMFKYKVEWSYDLSPKLSEVLNEYKRENPTDVLQAPTRLHRGIFTTTDVALSATDKEECKKMIRKWAQEVYDVWANHYPVVEKIAKRFVS